MILNKNSLNATNNQLYEGSGNVMRKIEGLKSLGVTPKKKIRSLEGTAEESHNNRRYTEFYITEPKLASVLICIIFTGATNVNNHNKYRQYYYNLKNVYNFKLIKWPIFKQLIEIMKRLIYFRGGCTNLYITLKTLTKEQIL